MQSNFQQFDNLKFADVYYNLDEFIQDYDTIGIPKKLANEETIKTIYYLLLARYANSTILNTDTQQFRMLVFSTIFQYGPTWEKRLEIQDKLRSLSLEENSEIYLGSKAIYNKAYNPSTEPTTADLEELKFINEQNTTNYKKGKLDGLAYLIDLLEVDVTENFLNRFRKLFKQIIYSGRTLLYETEV